MKVLVTGANGQLGYDVIMRLKSEGIDHLGTVRESLDILNKEQVKYVIYNYKPDVVIHCAAYTMVDKAEDENDMCYSVNVLGTKHVAEACKEIGAKMVYISTDYVFDGEGDQPFEVTDKPNPLNHYGKTKFEGELEVQNILDKYFIIRISWVFGIHGNNFVKTMLKLGKTRGEISVVADQVGSPTYTYDLAALLVEMIKTDRFGIYHATNEGYCSWYDFAREIFKQQGLTVNVLPINTEQYPTRAKRPRNSMISKNMLSENGFQKLQDWPSALADFLHYYRACIENLEEPK